MMKHDLIVSIENVNLFIQYSFVRLILFLLFLIFFKFINYEKFKTRYKSIRVISLSEYYVNYMRVNMKVKRSCSTEDARVHETRSFLKRFFF